MKRQEGSDNTIKAIETFRVLKEASSYKKAIELTKSIHSLNESQVKVLTEASKSSVQKKIDKCIEAISNIKQKIKDTDANKNEKAYSKLLKDKVELEETLKDYKKDLKSLKESVGPWSPNNNSGDDIVNNNEPQMPEEGLTDDEMREFLVDEKGYPGDEIFNDLTGKWKLLARKHGYIDYEDGFGWNLVNNTIKESEELAAEETTEIDPSQPNSYYFSSKEDIMCVNGLDHPRAQGLAVEIMGKFRSMFEEAFIKAEVEGNYILTLEFKQPEVNNDNPLEQETSEE